MRTILLYDTAYCKLNCLETGNQGCTSCREGYVAVPECCGCDDGYEVTDNGDCKLSKFDIMLYCNYNGGMQ